MTLASFAHLARWRDIAPLLTSGDAGQVLTATDALENRDVELEDFLNAIAGPWSAFTPTVAGWTLNDGTALGTYRVIGKTLDLRCTVTAGPATVFATNPTVTLPGGVALATPVRTQMGGALFFDQSTGATYAGFCRAATTTTLVCKGTGGDGNSNVTAAYPFAWAVSDEINFRFTGELA